MILKEENKDRLIDALIDWHTEAYYNNRSSFAKDDDGNLIGKNYRSFEAMLKIIKRLIRRAKMKTFVITEYPKLIRKWKVIGKNKKEAYENWLNDKIEFIEKDYDDEEWDNLTIEEMK